MYVTVSEMPRGWRSRLRYAGFVILISLFTLEVGISLLPEKAPWAQYPGERIILLALWFLIGACNGELLVLVRRKMGEPDFALSKEWQIIWIFVSPVIEMLVLVIGVAFWILWAIR